MFSAPSSVLENGVHDQYQTQPLLHRGIPQPGYDEYEEFLVGAQWAVISRLAPGGYLLPHRDKGPYYTRSHVPLEPAGWYWDQLQGSVRFTESRPYPVNHHLPHCVWNDSDAYRVTLVIDRYPIHSTGSFEQYAPKVCREFAEWLA